MKEHDCEHRFLVALVIFIDCVQQTCFQRKNKGERKTKGEVWKYCISKPSVFWFCHFTISIGLFCVRLSAAGYQYYKSQIQVQRGMPFMSYIVSLCVNDHENDRKMEMLLGMSDLPSPSALNNSFDIVRLVLMFSFRKGNRTELNENEFRSGITPWTVSRVSAMKWNGDFRVIFASPLPRSNKGYGPAAQNLDPTVVRWSLEILETFRTWKPLTRKLWRLSGKSDDHLLVDNLLAHLSELCSNTLDAKGKTEICVQAPFSTNPFARKEPKEFSMCNQVLGKVGHTEDQAFSSLVWLEWC